VANDHKVFAPPGGVIYPGSRRGVVLIDCTPFLLLKGGAYEPKFSNPTDNI